MTTPIPSLVSTDWLANAIGNERIVVLDATKHLPAAKRDARVEFEAAHIPSARFLDLASLANIGSPVPDALPTTEQVRQRLSDLGIEENDAIVLYDDSAVNTSARAWFTLMTAGIENVAILDGGFGKWRAEGRPFEDGSATQLSELSRRHPEPAESVRSKEDMLANCETGSEQVLDARAADRVFGSGIDPVHGGQNGRIPGSFNVPFGEVFRADGTFKSVDALKAVFKGAGLDLDQPIVTSCGSGVTASILLFALHLIGKEDVALYDGSWQEWSADPATPKVQGPQ